jgi:tetratricopeptide (TPR) repeat protein
MVAIATLSTLPALIAQGAEIVMLQGQGEKTEAPGPQPAGWVAAVQGDKVEGGFWVRTLANSQMALIVPERNQLRLAQNSVMQLKTEEESAEFKQARVKLAKGRAWSQARPRGAPGAQAQPALAMETPSATMSIRGTDWEVVVGEDGTTQLVVLSGEVEIGNEHGQLSVGKGEAARVEPGKAPEKLVLVDPESRVQWVSSWQPQPARWIGDESGRYAAELRRIEAGEYDAALAALEPRAAAEPGAALLAADLLIHDGRIARAVALLQPHAAQGAGDARASALLARALVRLDRLDEAERLLDAATIAHAGDAGLLLARGELATLRGDPARAESAFRAVLSDSAVGAGHARDSSSVGARLARDSDTAEAWYGLGLVASEREFVRQARTDLDRALAADPDLAKAAAERAAVETFASNLDDAAARYDALIAKDGANYVALTGRGINRLKQGDPDGALQDFMRAGLVEPRYARAWLYQGVAFYQLGERERAEQAFRKAEELDARDPIPHMMASQTASDRLDFGAAIAEARKAQEKMPWLRSLNQLANDQKGSANLGSPIANFGMEEWAKFYADKAYSPYWGGSHLFLADRYTGRFLKNSELMKGFLADPLAFGASNRNSSLVQKPGNYGRADAWFLNEEGYANPGMNLTANGLSHVAGDVAYFVRGSYEPIDSRKNGTTGDQRDLTGGIGWRPSHELGIFAFASDRDLDADIELPRDSPTDDEALPKDDQAQAERRGDIGLNYKIGPDNQLWIKGGAGEARNEQDGELYSRGAADAIESRFKVFGNTKVSPNGELVRNDTRIYEHDLQFRHAFAMDEADVSWGAEWSRQEQRLDFVTQFDAKSQFTGDTRSRIAQDEEFFSDDFQMYLSSRFAFAPDVTLQTDLIFQDVQGERFNLPTVSFGNRIVRIGASERQASSTNINPRVGIQWNFNDLQQLRLVAQRWRRPASFGTLAPIDTLGIALDDRLPAVGGKYDRIRLQYDGEFGGRLFVEAFADRAVIDNGLAGERTAFFSFQVEALSRLRVREEFFTAPDLIEATPIFPDGSVSSFGITGNYLLSDRQTLSSRYIYRYGDNNTDDLRYDGEIPYIPHQYFEIGSQWSLPYRVQLRTDAVYRSRRYQNDAIYEPAEGGWAFRVKSYWESVDKQHSVQLVLDNLFVDQKSMIEEKNDQFVNLQYTYRF